MGFLSKSKMPRTEVHRLPTGSFTVDPEGHVVSSTVPHSVPETHVREIGRQVLAVFKGAQNANLPFAELVVHYAAFKIIAREMRGGAIIFLTPRAMQLSTLQ